MEVVPSVQSLFFDLTSPSKEGFASTNAIKSLIDVVGADVCAFRRNTRVSYSFLELAGNLWTEINNLIKNVDQGDIDWDSYDKYVAAIDPLEKILLDFGFEADDERDAYLVDSTSIEKCIAFIGTWDKNRAQIRKSLEELRADKDLLKLGKSPKDFKQILQQDDITFLSELVAATKSHPAATNIKQNSLVKEVESGLDKILTQLEPALKSDDFKDDSLVLVTKCVMIIYGTLELLGKGDLNQESRFHMASETLWKAAKALLEDASLHMSSKTTTPTHAGLLTKYDAYVVLLSQHADVALPESYKSLIKLVGKIGRSYHAQAIALVTLCRTAADFFQKKDNQTVKNFLALESAFDQTAKTLQTSADAIVRATGTDSVEGAPISENNNTAPPPSRQSAGSGGSSPAGGAQDLGSSPASDQERAELFLKSAEEIKKCFEQIGLNSPPDPQAKLQLALSEDTKRAKEVNDKLQKSSSKVDPTELLSVTVNVRGGSRAGDKLHETTMLLRPSTRLSAVRWSLSDVPDLASKSVMTKSHFEHKDVADEKSARVPLDTTVGSLNDAERSKLCLVVEN